MEGFILIVVASVLLMLALEVSGTIEKIGKWLVKKDIL